MIPITNAKEVTSPPHLAHDRQCRKAFSMYRSDTHKQPRSVPISQRRRNRRQKRGGFELQQSGSLACTCNYYTIRSLTVPCIYTAISNSHSIVEKYLQPLEKRARQGPGRQATHQKPSIGVEIHLSTRNNSSSVKSIVSHEKVYLATRFDLSVTVFRQYMEKRLTIQVN